MGATPELWRLARPREWHRFVRGGIEAERDYAEAR